MKRLIYAAWLSLPAPTSEPPTKIGWYLIDNSSRQFSINNPSSVEPDFDAPYGYVWRYWDGKRWMWYNSWFHGWCIASTTDDTVWRGLTIFAHSQLMQG